MDKINYCVSCQAEMVGGLYCLPCQIDKLQEDAKRDRETLQKYWSIAYSACARLASAEKKSTTELLDEFTEKYERDSADRKKKYADGRL